MPYPSDLSDAEWAVLVPLLPPAKLGGRPRTVDVREVVNALLYVLRTGCAWRLLPHDFPQSITVYMYFRRWEAAGVWQAVPPSALSPSPPARRPRPDAECRRAR